MNIKETIRSVKPNVTESTLSSYSQNLNKISISICNSFSKPIQTYLTALCFSLSVSVQVAVLLCHYLNSYF